MCLRLTIFLLTEPENIGIIAPYNAQVQKIRKLLQNREIKVGSVEEFQGQARLSCLLLLPVFQSTHHASIRNVALSSYQLYEAAPTSSSLTSAIP